MGASGKWLKSLVTVKKGPTAENEKQGKKKWRLWRSSSEGAKGGHLAASRPSDFSSDDGLAAAMATVARVPPRDFMVVKQEWAAIRIQTAFRGLLARRASRALRAVVRLQAIFRGRQVRKQAAVTLRCMQALLRVQRRVRARNAGMSPESEAMENLEDEYYYKQADPIKKAEQGWCDSPGTVDDVLAKLQIRQDGAIKRERAIAYSLSQSQQRSRSCGSPWRRTHNSGRSLKHQALEHSSPGWSWLDRWMTSRQSENIPMAETRADSSEAPCARKSEDNIAGFLSHSYKHDPVKVMKNNVTTRVSAKPSVINISTRSSSGPSSESVIDESSPSTSSTSVSPIPLSSKTLNVDSLVESHNQKPRFMNLTESIKAKQRASRNYTDIQNYNTKDRFLVRSIELSYGDNKSVAGSNPSSILCSDLYPPISLGGHGIRNRRY